jgi:hypothetical protein
MIGFFRQIRQNLLMENKTGKYIKYAVGEIFLVMIGILLAWQVSNWNQQRIAQNKEQILLSELHQEFVENKIQFDIVVGKHQLALDACKWIRDQFPIDIEEVAMDSLKWKRIDMKKEMDIQSIARGDCIIGEYFFV